MWTRNPNRGRRDFLRKAGAVPSTLLLLSLADKVSATPACADEHEPTRRQTPGPFFLPDSPQRTSLLEPGIGGTKIVLSGRVWSSRCKAVPGALLDFWHADDHGEYDIDGFRLRGHQFSDSEGRYRLETIVPGGYPGRTRHFHVTVRAPRGSRTAATGSRPASTSCLTLHSATAALSSRGLTRFHRHGLIIRADRNAGRVADPSSDSPCRADDGCATRL
jgi:hypothetical protein